MLDQDLFPRPVAVVHPSHLRKRHVGFVYKYKRILGEKVHQGPRRVARLTPVEKAGIVLDPRAIPDLKQHLEVILRPHPEPLGLDYLPRRLKLPRPLIQLLLYQLRRPVDGVGRSNIVLGRKDPRMVLAQDRPPANGIDLLYSLYLVIEEHYPDRGIAVCRKYLHRLSPAPEISRLKHEIVSLVIVVEKPRHKRPAVPFLPHREAENRVLVVLPLSKPVDARNAGDHDNVAPFKERLGGSQAKLLYPLVDRGVLLNVDILGRHIGFRLVIVVIADKVVHRVLREKILKLAVKLRRQSLIVRHDKGRPLQPLYDVCHGKSLSAPRDSEQSLLCPGPGETGDKPLHRLRLISGHRPWRKQLKFLRHKSSPQ